MTYHLYYYIFCEFQQQLFSAGISECDGGFGVLARALNLYDVANAKALMLNDITHFQPYITYR